MIYAVDIGNTRIKIGHFEADELQKIEIYDLGDGQNWKASLKNKSREAMILGSTSLKEEKIIEDCELKRAYTMDAYTQYPLRFTYDKLWMLGKDRRAASVAAFFQAKGKTALIIDAGTCVTYDIVEHSGIHLGGMISPGIDMRYASMHTLTAQLPLVEEKDYLDKIATNTYDALRSGGKYGLLLEIKAYIRWLKQLYGDICVYVSGGHAQFLKNNLPDELILEKHLVLQGLYEIYQWNEHKN